MEKWKDNCLLRWERSSGGHDVGGSRENVLVESGDILRCL